jgi:hypothetical protein
MGKNNVVLSHDLGEAHASLLADLCKLEQAVRPASAESPASVLGRLTATRAHITEHFRFEEQDGYMDAVRKREPRLERAVQQLADEHRLLAKSLDDLLQEAGAAKVLNDAFGERVREWVTQVREHEARETDLVQAAFNQDMGTED